HLEGTAADVLEAGHHFERAQRLRSAKLDGAARSGRMPQAERAHFRDVEEGDPTDRAGSRAVDARRSIGIVESERGAEPDFHEPARLNDGEVHAGDCPFRLLLRIVQRAGKASVTEGNQQESLDAVRTGSVDELQLAVAVYRFDRIAVLARERRGSGRNHRI